MSVMSRSLRNWMALGALLLAGLTLVVPIQVWHHHSNSHDAERCQVCAIVSHIVATPCELGPTLSIPPVRGSYIRQPECLVTLSADRLPSHARAPPLLLHTA